MRYVPLVVPEEPTKRETESMSRMQKAKGGTVDVPNAPAEPDERIDKLTGRPYNEQAGAAYMDEEDPMRRLGFKGGGEVDPLSRLGFGIGDRVYAKGVTYFKKSEAPDPLAASDGTDIGSTVRYRRNVGGKVSKALRSNCNHD
jgi:hypothetical protein